MNAVWFLVLGIGTVMIVWLVAAAAKAQRCRRDPASATIGDGGTSYTEGFLPSSAGQQHRGCNQGLAYDSCDAGGGDSGGGGD